MNLTRFVIPVFSGIGALLTILTIMNYESWTDSMIYFTYFLLIACVIMALVGAVVGVMSKPSTLKQSAIGIGAMLLVLAISYGMASDEILSSYPEGVSTFEVKWSGVGLYMFYTLFFGAIGSIVVTWIYGLIKK